MKKGFTLIELLIVISIIGILAVALLPNILSAPATARDAGRKAALNNVLAALEQYKAANGNYPSFTNGVGTGTAEVLPASLTSYFKGGDLPVGATVPTEGETVLGLGVAAGSTSVVYCPFDSTGTDNGYSYAVAIRMEQKQGGTNGLNMAAENTCADATGENLSGGTAGNWYFLVQ
jgi:prepilin-type N-terminal cleavage/methylation domain-containing protein